MLSVSFPGMEPLLSWIVAVTALLLVTFWWNVPGALVRLYRQWRALRNLPHQPYHWLWGNAHQIARRDKTLQEIAQFVQKGRYKVTARWMGPFLPMIVVHHYETMKKVLKEPKDVVIYHILSPWLGDGLLISRGQKWHRNRHLLTPAFHFEILKSYVSVYNSCLDILLQKWSAAASKKEPVKLFETISLLSLDILLQCAFSSKSNCQMAESHHPYISGVHEVSVLITQRIVNPLHLIDWLYFLTPAGRRMRKACRKVHEYAENVIKERKQALGLAATGKLIDRNTLVQNAVRQGKHLDFLDILLTARDEEGNGLTDLEIRDEVDTFMFEGHDTTTSGMCWILYCLAKYPEHQDKVREEVRNVLDGRKWLEYDDLKELKYDDLKELKYTLWCVKEAMRLYPPVNVVTRMASEDLELDGHVIPEGTTIHMHIYSLHHHPDIWDNPEEFDPLRFHPANAKGRDPFAYLVFSAGYRNCIGQNFAMNEESIVVATIVNKFSLSLVEDHKVEMVLNVVLRAKNDIKVELMPL